MTRARGIVAGVVALALLGCGALRTSASTANGDHSAPEGAAASPGPPEPAEPPSCAGEIDPAGALAAVRARDAAVRDCYEQEILADESTRRLALRVALVVGAAGDVTEVRLDPEVTPERFGTCVGTALSTIRFPALTRGTCAVLLIPYDFSPEARP